MQLSLQADGSTPLYQQLYEQLCAQILRGELAANEPLPASRKLAEQLNVSRITVKAAYDKLTTEGFTITRQGAGTFVAELPLPPTQSQVVSPTLSRWAERVHDVPRSPVNNSKGMEIDFGFGRIFPHQFPYDIWRKLLARYLSTDDTLLDRYGSAAGFEPLRRVLCDYLLRVRGIHCHPDQVVIVNGMQQAVDILARLFIEPGDEVVVESPGYVEAYRLFEVYGAQLRPIAVDQDGLPVEQLAQHSSARLAFVTPANQFPNGGTLPLPRRLQLLRWAQRNNAFILEDDYDSELRYDGRHVSALQTLDTENRVIYLGTFSKVLFPALRLAYVVLPPALAQPFLATKRLIDRGSPTLMQAAIADFILEGHFERHLRRLRATYGERRAQLAAALDHHLPDLSYTSTQAGLHILLHLPVGMDEAAVVKSAEALNLGTYPASPYSLITEPAPALLLAFSSIDTNQIDAGIQRLKQAVMLNSSRIALFSAP